MSAATVDDLDLERLADELLVEDDERVEDVEDVEDQDDDPPALLLRPSTRRPPRRSVTDPRLSDAMLNLVGLALGARIAHDTEDDDLALDRLEQTERRAGELAALLRARLEALPPAPARYSA